MMLAFFQGKKTYFVGIALIAYAALGWFTGRDSTLDMKTVMEGLGLLALRAGIAKREP